MNYSYWTIFPGNCLGFGIICYLLFAFLIAASTPVYKKDADPMKQKSSKALPGVFFWFLLLLLLVAIIGGLIILSIL
ncbi:MAG: hypothetical protein R6V23_07410 [Bacteroidales bacterium]